MKKSITLVLLVVLLLFAAGCGIQPPPPANPTGAIDTSNLIGEEKAIAIALEQAGIPKDGVTFERIELDRDDKILHYEIEFLKGQTEYDVDIKADDGTVLAFEKDYRD